MRYVTAHYRGVFKGIQVFVESIDSCGVILLYCEKIWFEQYEVAAVEVEAKQGDNFDDITGK